MKSFEIEKTVEKTFEKTRKKDFDFHLTEGQSRRGLMADCESECSPIFDFLYVGGAEIAKNWNVLESHNITRIVNCSASVVENHFIDNPRMTYLSLNMVDGRQDDISWFLGDVLQFILSRRSVVNLNFSVIIFISSRITFNSQFSILNSQF